LLLGPSLWSGFWLDDYYYIGSFKGDFPELSPDWNLLPFFVGDEEATANLARMGRYPWWIDDTIQLVVFRPLFMLSLQLDYLLHGNWSVGYHLHSLAWWLATLVGCGLVLRRGLPGAIGLLALLLFALDEVHVLPVAWVANRNALLALTPLLFGLWAHIRWREDGWPPGRWLALAGMTVALLSGEIALSACAYLVAYELVGLPGTSCRERLVGLAPMLGLGALYFVVYRLMGCGAVGCGLYIDPLYDPVNFLTRAASSIPTLLASGIAGVSADFWFVSPESRPLLVVVGCLALVGLGGLLRWCWPDLDATHQRNLLWLLCGSGLALIPTIGTLPSDRMVFIPGIGLAATLATVLFHFWQSWRRQVRPWWLFPVGGWLVLVHLIAPPFLSLYVQKVLQDQANQALEIAASPVVYATGGRETVLIHCPDYTVGLYLPMLINHLDGPPPKSWRTLSLAPYDHTLRRIGPRSLELEVASGGVLLRSLFEELYRDRRRMLQTGDSLDRGLFRAEILASSEAGPTRIAFHFARDLTDPGLCFLAWQAGQLQPIDLPAEGDEIRFERSLGPGGF